VKIISKRGRTLPTEQTAEITHDILVVDIGFYGTDLHMTPEEIAHIEQVFDAIRKQLEQIADSTT
jgi:hypothetical protein